MAHGAQQLTAHVIGPSGRKANFSEANREPSHRRTNGPELSVGRSETTDEQAGAWPLRIEHGDPEFGVDYTCIAGLKNRLQAGTRFTRSKIGQMLWRPRELGGACGTSRVNEQRGEVDIGQLGGRHA